MVVRLSCSHVIKIDVPLNYFFMCLNENRQRCHCRRPSNIFTDHLVWPSIVYIAIFICAHVLSINKFVVCVSCVFITLESCANAFAVPFSVQCVLELRKTPLSKCTFSLIPFDLLLVFFAPCFLFILVNSITFLSW